MKRILIILGTRPEAIKLAPVVFALRERPADAEVLLCSTGQHRDMLRDTLQVFDLAADYDLDLMRDNQHPTELLGRTLQALAPLMSDVQPDVVVVQGDTSTVMAGALAGFFQRTRVAHVEAGLRTRDKHAPFPEEINRRVTSVVADYHFAPTPGARDKLLAEQIPAADIFVTGNTIVDALRWMRANAVNRPLRPELDPGARRMILVTAHRRESFGQPFRELCTALREIADRFEDVVLVYPVHLNPNVQQPVHEILGNHERIRLIEPLAYDEFVGALSRSHLVITDSGGIQEEAPALGKPALVMRDKTERPEAVAAGVVRLVGTSRSRIVAEVETLLTDSARYEQMAQPRDIYGDGRAAQRIAEVLLDGKMRTPELTPKF